MRPAHRVTTRFPTGSDVAAHRVRRLADLINEVYDDAESGMWKRQDTRMHPELVPDLATECDFTVWHKPLV